MYLLGDLGKTPHPPRKAFGLSFLIWRMGSSHTKCASLTQS